MSKPLVILDRDGVINHDSDNYIKSLEEWIPIEGSINAIANLSKSGFLIAIATNQSGFARGLFDEFTLANMHSYMCSLVEEAGGQVDGVFFCPHSPDEDCSCRKPKPGLLEQIEKEFSVSVTGAYFVGDSEKDIDVALSKSCIPILVKTGKGSKTLKALSASKLSSLIIVEDLQSAADYILKSQA